MSLVDAYTSIRDKAVRLALLELGKHLGFLSGEGEAVPLTH